MATLENLGLRVVEVDDMAALTADPAGAAPHAIRIDIDRFDWSACGYRDDIVARPGLVHWICPAGGGAAGVIANQSTAQRQRSRGAARSLAAFDMEVSDPIDAALFDEWAVLYKAQVRRLTNGRDLAGLFRRRVLASGSGHALIGWRDRGVLVCGTVIAVDHGRSALTARFSAVREDARNAELPRAMYLAAADMAAERGLRWVTLGTDVNVTGGLIRAGLSAFKLRLGFRPVPADLFGLESTDVAERVTSTEGLNGPVVRFEYRRPRPAISDIDDFFDGPDALGLVSVTSLDDDRELRAFPPHRRLVVES